MVALLTETSLVLFAFQEMLIVAGEREPHVVTVVLGISVVLIVVGAIPVIVVSQVIYE